MSERIEAAGEEHDEPCDWPVTECVLWDKAQARVRESYAPLVAAARQYLADQQEWDSVQSMTGSETWQVAADRLSASESALRALLAEQA